MAIELEDTLHADGSLEMTGDRLRVSAALQAKIAAPIAVAEEGMLVGSRAAINFVGDAITAVDNPGANRVDVTLIGSVGSAFSIATDINPLHWWRAANAIETAGLADALVDQGSLPKNFTATAADRAPIPTDPDGNKYLALDGFVDFYQSGVAADWKFLSNGSPWTIAILYHRTALLTAYEALLDTSNGTSTTVGMTIWLNYISATQQGILGFVSRAQGAGFLPLQYASNVPDTNKTCVVVRHTGTNVNGTATQSISVDLVLRRRGILVANTQWQANAAFDPGNPASALRLGKAGSASFSSARIYDVIIDNKAWSDRQVAGYEEYARTTYKLAM